MSKRPNIILINCDDLGYGDLGCYGSKLNKTPVLDRLAQQGVRLSNFYSGSPLCSPSRGGMMTGCYPPRVSFGEFDGRLVLFPGMAIGLDSQEDTIPSMLKNAGYKTKLVGKWHCGDQPEHMPLAHGFEEYFGLPYSNDMGRQNGRTDYPPLPLMDGAEIAEQQPDQCSITDRYTEKCVEFIERNVENPFFLYLAHMHVHRPLYAEKRFVEQSDNGDFGACVEAIDWSTGVIVERLEQLGIAENTLIIFTSDNGGLAQSGGTNAPLAGRKGTTFEGGQRVPCIMYQKGVMQSAVLDGIMSNIDFLPTLLSLCGVEQKPKNPIDGIDCSDFILGKEESPRKLFFYYLGNSLEAVREGDWKLHVAKKDYTTDREAVKLLYNLRDDVGETNNLYDERPEIVERLCGIIEKFKGELGDSFTKVTGCAVRAAGRVDDPKPLTSYNEDHPYIVAMYDRDDIG